MHEETPRTNEAFIAGRPTVVVIGGGFGGLLAIHSLRNANANVLLLDKRNFHLFQPLLYQVATSVLTPSEIAFPLRRIFAKQKNVTTLLAEVNDIDPAAHTVSVGDSLIPFDYLVLAAGAETNYFGEEKWKAVSPGLKNIVDATNVRNRVLAAFERAEVEIEEDNRSRQLTFVVVGGGATGVELAGSIQELAVDSISHDFRFVDTETARVVLIEGGKTLLNGFSAPSREYAERVLKQKGVEVMLNTRVIDVDENGVKIQPAGSDSETQRIESKNVIWAAGVRGNPLGDKLTEAAGLEARKDGRVVVEPDLTLPGHPEIYVVGDLAAAKDVRHGGEVPGVAPGAIQMGAYAGRSILLRLRGKSATSIKAFAYHDKGSMATIGRARAVAEVRSIHMKGFFAWLAWGALHIRYLIGFRNRFITLFSWLMTYLFYTKGSRLITDNVPIAGSLPKGIGISASKKTTPEEKKD